ncbi:serine hydrolase, partial [Staphylococcus epidermidis]
AYMMTNTKDLASWLKFQLNPPKKVASLVQLTHQPRVKAIDNSQDVHYAAGWFIDDNHSETIVYHPGTLENYSSYIILNPKKDYGIVVLAN